MFGWVVVADRLVLDPVVAAVRSAAPDGEPSARVSSSAVRAAIGTTTGRRDRADRWCTRSPRGWWCSGMPPYVVRCHATPYLCATVMRVARADAQRPTLRGRCSEAD